MKASHTPVKTAFVSGLLAVASAGFFWASTPNIANADEPKPAKPKAAEEKRPTVRELFEKEIELIQRHIDYSQSTGRAPAGGVFELNRDILRLQRELAMYEEQQGKPPAETQKAKEEATVKGEQPAPKAPQALAPKSSQPSPSFLIHALPPALPQPKTVLRPASPDHDAKLKEIQNQALKPLLEIARNDADPAVRRAAVEAIGSLRADEAMAALSDIVLSDADMTVRRAALMAVLLQRNQAGTDALVQLYDQIKDEVLKLDLINGWVELRRVDPNRRWALVVPPRALPKFLQTAQQESSQKLRQAAITKLAEIEGAEASKALAALYDEIMDGQIKLTIIDLLGVREDEASLSKLSTIARSDPDQKLRVKAINGVAKIALDAWNKAIKSDPYAPSPALLPPTP